MTGRYDFTNVKLSKVLRFFSVAEAHGLIYPRPSGKNFRFATKPQISFKKLDVTDVKKPQDLKGLTVNLVLGLFKQCSRLQSLWIAFTF